MSFGTRKHALVRLRRDIKHSQREDREEPDVIISELGSATLRHIKARRAKGSDVKVAVTVADENQLREIFDAFDFEKSGNVSLLEFDKALDFIRLSRHFRKLHKELDNLQQTFIDMDIDGDATVDYQEFTIGMTGTANGALDGFSPSDLNKLLAKFKEFAMITKRQRNIDAISLIDYHESDIVAFKYFNRIFELHGQDNDSDSVVASDAGSSSRPVTSQSQSGGGGGGGGGADMPASLDMDAEVPERQAATPLVTRRTTNLANSLMDSLDDVEDERLKQRILDERVLLEESMNLRYEVLKLPPIPSRVPTYTTKMPSMVIMKPSAELKLRYKVRRTPSVSVRSSTRSSLLLSSPSLSSSSASPDDIQHTRFRHRAKHTAVSSLWTGPTHHTAWRHLRLSDCSSLQTERRAVS
jgi:hypothetical protein